MEQNSLNLTDLVRRWLQTCRDLGLKNIVLSEQTRQMPKRRDEKGDASNGKTHLSMAARNPKTKDEKLSKRQAVSEGNPCEVCVAQRKSVKRDDGKNLRDFPHSREKNAGSLLCAEAASLPRGEEGLAIVRKELEQCLRCGLAKGRETIVFGEGSAEAKLMFIGEGPGRDEDLQGRPFVGRAGQLLTKIIEAIQLKRQDVYITNVVKCRPPDNRTPMPDEISTCLPFLLKQIAVVRPKIIVALGKTAASVLLQTEEPITRLRGHFYTWDHIRVMPTFHPAYLLRNPEMKRYVWEDMKLVRKALDELQSENGSEN